MDTYAKPCSSDKTAPDAALAPNAAADAFEVPIRIKRLPEGAGLPYPAYMTADAAGADCYAAVAEPVVLGSLERALVPLGFALEIPSGYEVQVRPRSGAALKLGLTLLNSPGTIDADYRGPVGAIVVNLSAAPITIARGDRVAQIVVAAVARARFVEAAELDPSVRGAGGFGSTGA